MLLPALGKARARAQEAKCANNLKQFALANIMYANDNQDFLPYVDTGHTYNAMNGYLGYEFANGTPGVTREKGPLMYCPVVYFNTLDTNPTGEVYYTWVDRKYWDSDLVNPVCNLSQARSASQKFMLLEISRGSSGCSGTRYYWTNKNVFVHSDKQNSAFLDGHVQSIKNLQAPYFFAAISTANGNAAKPHWDYKY